MGCEVWINHRDWQKMTNVFTFWLCSTSKLFQIFSILSELFHRSHIYSGLHFWVMSNHIKKISIFGLVRCLPSNKAAQQQKFSGVSVSRSAFHCRYNSYVNFSSFLSQLPYLYYWGHDNMSSIIWHFWPLGRDILTSEFDINGRRGEESVMNFILT